MTSALNAAAVWVVLSIVAGAIWIYVRTIAYPSPRCICGHHEWQHHDNGNGQVCVRRESEDGTWHYCTCRAYKPLGRTWTE
jgi:hypothetical protein